jgi:hypothetical protein
MGFFGGYSPAATGRSLQQTLSKLGLNYGRDWIMYNAADGLLATGNSRQSLAGLRRFDADKAFFVVTLAIPAVVSIG